MQGEEGGEGLLLGHHLVLGGQSLEPPSKTEGKFVIGRDGLDGII